MIAAGLRRSEVAQALPKSRKLSSRIALSADRPWRARKIYLHCKIAASISTAVIQT